MNPSTCPISRAAIETVAQQRASALDVAEHQRRKAEIRERTCEEVLILPLPADRQAFFEELQRALVLAAV